MIQSAIRRPALALTFAFLFAAPVFANGVTGTDPCPKGTVCTQTAVTTTKSATPSPTTSATTSSSPMSAAMQALLSFLGLS